MLSLRLLEKETHYIHNSIVISWAPLTENLAGEKR